MSGIVTFAPSLVPTKRTKSVEKDARRNTKVTISADRRSGLLRPTNPRPATVPLPCPSVGDSGPSRHVPDVGAAKDGRERGCRRQFSGVERVEGVCRDGEWSLVLGEPP